MRSFFRAGFIAYTAMVVLIGIGAYAGVLPAIRALPHYDKIMHALLIGGVAFFLDGTLRHRPLFRGYGSFAGAIVLVVAGVEEWAQRFSPRRSSSFGDFAADVVGVVGFVLLARWIGRERRSSQDA